jgi:ParB-like chromosome segregation protein Spo0J
MSNDRKITDAVATEHVRGRRRTVRHAAEHERTIVDRNIDHLKAFDRNARKHSRAQVKKIAASIEKFGFINPVLVDGRNRIVAGHGRVEAAKFLGRDKVPTLSVEHLSEDELRAYLGDRAPTSRQD